MSFPAAFRQIDTGKLSDHKASINIYESQFNANEIGLQRLFEPIGLQTLYAPVHLSLRLGLSFGLRLGTWSRQVSVLIIKPLGFKGRRRNETKLIYEINWSFILDF